MKILHILSVLFFLKNSNPFLDYWDDDYDQGKNCDGEEEIEELNEQNKSQDQCVINNIEDPVEAIRKCKHDLAAQLVHVCRETKLTKPGKFLYCKNRGQTSCCFKDHMCASNWTVLERDHPLEAYLFLKDPELVLRKIRKTYGFKTCHQIKGYDATKCAEECEKIKESPLAKECEKKKGLLKCCVRRDKHFCHECRYCCTLPFCSYKNKEGVINHIGESDVMQNVTEKSLKNSELGALQYIDSREIFLKGQDTRCLKPNSDDDPEKWEHYDVDDFPNAVNEVELSKAKTVKFDKRFFNYEDPEVLEQVTGDNYQEALKDIYGFDFVSRIRYDAYNDRHSLIYNCTIDCAKAEQTEFAKECRKEGGLFKCCVCHYNFYVFDETRKQLSKEKLISPYESMCEHEATTGRNCRFCTSSYFCSSWDRNDGSVKTKYKTENFNPVGGLNVKDHGKFKRYPLKASWCIYQNLCYIKELYFDTEEFLLALEQKDVCDALPNGTPDILTEKPEDCRKRKSNIRTCSRNLTERMILDSDTIANPKDWPNYFELKALNKDIRKLRKQFLKKRRKGRKANKKKKKKRKKKKKSRKKKKSKKKKVKESKIKEKEKS